VALSSHSALIHPTKALLLLLTGRFSAHPMPSAPYAPNDAFRPLNYPSQSNFPGLFRHPQSRTIVGEKFPATEKHYAGWWELSLTRVLGYCGGEKQNVVRRCGSPVHAQFNARGNRCQRAASQVITSQREVSRVGGNMSWSPNAIDTDQSARPQPSSG